MKKMRLAVIGLTLSLFNVFAQQDVVLDYSFNNETDASIYGNDFINHGATLTEDRFGNADAALYFDGVNDYLEIPADPSYQLTEFPFSVSVWVYLEDSSSSNNRIFRNGTGGTNYGGVMIDAVTINAASYGDGEGRGPLDRYTIIGEDTLSSKKWHQIVVVSHKFDSTEIFLDGKLSENITTSGSGTSLQLASDATGKIGANLTQNTNNYLHGKLDELKMWNRALTQEEIANNYVPHSQSELVLDFQFENESTMDDSKYGNHAINYGATATEDRFGKLNAALYFDGVNDYLEIPTDPSYQLTEFPFSVSVWVYLEDSSSSNNHIFRNGTGGTDYGGVMIDATTRTIASYGDGEGRGPLDRNSFIGEDTLSSKQWHQIVVVSHNFDSTEIFLDGKLNENITTSGTGTSLQLASGATGKIGANLTQNTKYYLHGKLDELKMWKGALTQGEVKAMYRPYEGPVLYVPKFVDNDNTQIYPNPTFSTVNFVGLNNGTSVEVLNLQGEHVLDTKIVNGMVDLSVLKSDLYILKTEKIAYKVMKK